MLIINYGFDKMRYKDNVFGWINPIKQNFTIYRIIFLRLDVHLLILQRVMASADSAFNFEGY
jgi:hypothetical protein